MEPDIGSLNRGNPPDTQQEEGDEPAEPARTSDSENVHATLDMLVTIIGKFYGQKDLLDGRLLWDEIDST